MKSNLKNLLLVTATLTSASSSAFGATALIDFGRVNTIGSAYNAVTIGSNITAGNAGDSIDNWRLNGGGSNLSSVALADTTGSSTGWTLDATITAISGGTSAQPEFAAAGADNSTVANWSELAKQTFSDFNPLAGGLYVQFGGAVKFTLSGLTDGVNYDLLGLVGRDNAGASALATMHLVTGTASSAFYYQGSNGAIVNSEASSINPNDTNQSLTFGWNNVQSSGGMIEFTLESGPTAGGANLINLQALSIIAVPEPSTALFSGLGLLALLRRRRA